MQMIASSLLASRADSKCLVFVVLQNYFVIHFLLKDHRKYDSRTGSESDFEDTRILRKKSVTALPPLPLLPTPPSPAKDNLRKIRCTFRFQAPNDLPQKTQYWPECLRSTENLGKNSTLAVIQKKFWIPGVSSLLKSFMSKCNICRRYQSSPLQQKMANLPPEKL